MSIVGKQNFRHRPSIADAVVRTVLMGRDAARYLAEEGTAVLRPEQAYELGLCTSVRTWRRVGIRWVSEPAPLPAMGVECLRAFDAGAAVAEAQDSASAGEDGYFEDFHDSRFEDDFSPATSVHAAFWESDFEKSRQEDAAWVRQELGGFDPEALPVFLVRVKG